VAWALGKGLVGQYCIEKAFFFFFFFGWLVCLCFYIFTFFFYSFLLYISCNTLADQYIYIYI
jgi:hypothetical protein